MEFLHERAVAAPAEGNALCLAAKAHIQAAVFAGMIVKILLQRALHPSGSVNIAAAQRGEDLPELGKDRELSEGGKFGLQAVDKDALGRGPRLHGDTLACKVFERVDTAAHAHDGHALGIEIGTGPKKLVLASAHRQTAP